jgi:hypothetical protein
MEAKTQENKTIEIRGPKNTDRRKPRRSDRRIYTEINSALTVVETQLAYGDRECERPT